VFDIAVTLANLSATGNQCFVFSAKIKGLSFDKCSRVFKSQALVHVVVIDTNRRWGHAAMPEAEHRRKAGPAMLPPAEDNDNNQNH
jgi:hypothetical protein